MPKGPYLTPRAILSGRLAGEAVGMGLAWPLCGGRLAFMALEATQRNGHAVFHVLAGRAAFGQVPCGTAEGDAVEKTLAALARPRRAFAGLRLEAPLLMGIVNVTPDSFSDGGAFMDPGAAIAHGAALLDAGAAVIDVGGESTRPGAAPVDSREEIRRVVPVVKALAGRGACVSIDTRHAAVMRAAVDAGARIINDVTALRGDGALDAAAKSGAAVILMHMQGEPRTMQDNPGYAWAPGDVFDDLARRIAACVDAGIAADGIAADPGIGFGKTVSHNAQILDRLAMFHGLGCPLALGVSRKSFIGRMSAGEGALGRLPGSVAAALHSAAQGVQILRVHDVAETRQALAVQAGITADG